MRAVIKHIIGRRNRIILFVFIFLVEKNFFLLKIALGYNNQNLRQKYFSAYFDVLIARDTEPLYTCLSRNLEYLIITDNIRYSQYFYDFPPLPYTF